MTQRTQSLRQAHRPIRVTILNCGIFAVRGRERVTDPADAITSASLLFAHQTTTSALLIYGHAPAQWTTLRKAPVTCL